MKILILLAVVLVVATAAGAVYFRRVADDPTVWHVDPLTATKPDSPNAALIRPAGGDGTAPVFAVPPLELAAAIDDFALGEGRTKRIAGTPAELWMTYVQRSALFGFPDYISVRVLPEGEGATYAAFSRSRYGHSDMGVNASRLARWQAALETRLGN
ncbi:hypothetical protein RGUI_1520 [Rhodovulum sp. P5]|uniref:DUF1499 domain-containing protein n=1 Tax=Rhodovulum sp. P5 TaxID=1564506 RepID=UPI0009C33A15|nr:DUF1499 domain-containing protein [Rhodovulum sp. P5]ARE39661.1 hypothetical protein RGUI_1520 [Rhodovulum sp. P5]